MTINFAISEFNITGQPIPENVCDKLLKWHISPMIEVRQELNIPIWASQESGYRPESWEKEKGKLYEEICGELKSRGIKA